MSSPSSSASEAEAAEVLRTFRSLLILGALQIEFHSVSFLNSLLHETILAPLDHFILHFELAFCSSLPENGKLGSY
eukprot:scaffold609129_cov19-Prasinocladus_malaysianus.AAC.1